jgi:peroxiredoxin family protein
MTVELFGMDRGEFIPEIADWLGAASFLPVAQRADVNLFV